MREHLEALRTHLEPLGYSIHLYYANPISGQPEGTVPPVPYLVLRGAWSTPSEAPICGDTDDLDATVYVTAAATTAEGAGVVLGRVRELLSPHSNWSTFQVTGRNAQIKRNGSDIDPTVDRDLRLPNSDRHPGFGVDSYRLYSIPNSEAL